MLTKHAIVMERSKEPSFRFGILFVIPPDEDGNPGRDSISLDPNVWRDMGEPNTVTVLIEPGATL